MPLRDVLSSPSLAASYNLPLLDTKKQSTGVSPCAGTSETSLSNVPASCSSQLETRCPVLGSLALRFTFQGAKPVAQAGSTGIAPRGPLNLASPFLQLPFP